MTIEHKSGDAVHFCECETQEIVEEIQKGHTEGDPIH